MYPTHTTQPVGNMFGGQATGSLGFGQQTNNASMSLGGTFGQQPQSGTGNPPFDPTKVW